ncbi:MAG: TonB-dependent receptor [Candidatus Omnitrophica bacterium]|nr:TonB-dependent receptor [Candidatus Omnitrophota bacterium]
MLNRDTLLGVLGVMLCCCSVCGAQTVDLNRIVVTPGRVAEDAAQASSNVTVISRVDLEHSNVKTVGDVLTSVPGVNVTNQGSAHSTLVDIRGYADAAVSNVLVLVNGRRTNPMDMSGPDWQQIPIDSVERIEVIRGGASVLYGDKASGGVVNIITKEGVGKDTATLFSEVGSYASQKYGVEASGAREKLAYYLYSDYSDMKGYRDNSWIRAKNEQARFSYTVNDQVKLGIEGGTHQEDYGMPGYLRGSELLAVSRRGTLSPNDNGHTADDFIKISSELTPVDAQARYGKVLVDYSHRDRHAYIWNWYETAVPPTFFASKSLIKSDGLTIKHVWDGDVAGRKLNTVTGVDYYNDRNHILASSPAGDGDNLTITKRSVGIYTHSEYEMMDHVFVNAGARHETAQYMFDQYNVTAYTTQTPRVNVYSGGMKYEYARGSNVFFNAQKTFRFLASDEWYQTWTTPPQLNLDLKQQAGMDYQMGVKHNVNDVLEVSATPFLTVNKNEIFLDYLNGGVNSNYGRTRRKGIDVGLKFDAWKLVKPPLLRHWDIFTNYAYMDARFDKGAYGAKLIPRVPRHLATLGMDAGLTQSLSWNLTGRWTGAQYMNNDTLNAYPRIKPFAVVDTKVSYKMRMNVDVYFGINNLLDEKYNSYTSVDTTGAYGDVGMSYNYPAPERNYVMGMKCVF